MRRALGIVVLGFILWINQIGCAAPKQWQAETDASRKHDVLHIDDDTDRQEHLRLSIRVRQVEDDIFAEYSMINMMERDVEWSLRPIGFIIAGGGQMFGKTYMAHSPPATVSKESGRTWGIWYRDRTIRGRRFATITPLINGSKTRIIVKLEPFKWGGLYGEVILSPNEDGWTIVEPAEAASDIHAKVNGPSAGGTGGLPASEHVTGN